jgi:hypothetical protein
MMVSEVEEVTLTDVETNEHSATMARQWRDGFSTKAG